MRWDRLFDDLEGQLERESTAEELDLQAEDERLRLGRLGLRERLAALRDHSIVVWGLEDAPLRLRVLTLGRDWFTADRIDGPARARQVLVPLQSVTGVSVSVEAIEPSLRGDPGAEPELTARLGLPFVLRDLGRRRHPITVELATGPVHGTVDRVGRDHLDLALHEPGAPRRAAAVSEVRIVPLAAIRVVRL